MNMSTLEARVELAKAAASVAAAALGRGGTQDFAAAIAAAVYDTLSVRVIKDAAQTSE